MERWLGWPALQRILSTHFERWKFKHPTPDDFFAVANEVSGQDLGWFFDQVYRSSNVFDYGVQDLKSARDGDQYRTTVVVRRYGEAIFPGGRARDLRERRTRDRALGRQGSLEALHLRSPGARRVSAQVDPNRVLLLDVELHEQLEDARAAEARRRATKWSMTWMVWLQDCLLSWAALA